MDTLKIGASARTPEVDFDFDANVYRLKGECYPEDIAEFFAPLMDRLREHFARLRGARVDFTFELIYFNSSSAKAILGLFDLLEQTAKAGNDVAIVWACEEGDDIQEMGEEFAEDLTAAKFRLQLGE
ncbi:MAG: DUF1987 domain-containing protein [Desulfovibrionaceae bacterium]|nr:DUF1987 domain-containing protein [Desulfovibrionaceae bacterium]MBF0512824.1 DUF1987 domain-containing protein [Desulfovibrionaceae bacterium]